MSLSLLSLHTWYYYVSYVLYTMYDSLFYTVDAKIVKSKNKKHKMNCVCFWKWWKSGWVMSSFIPS